MYQELFWLDIAITKLIGKRLLFFRIPYGALNYTVLFAVETWDYKVVG
jgi:peptidoglycan/xylan/chitin deacetylase (PgdA/CDA1 family)